jgi:hypothetical protein
MRHQFAGPITLALLLCAALGCKAEELPLHQFVKEFVASCTSDEARKKQFHLSHIHFPLRYTFSVVSDEGKKSQSGVMQELKLNPQTGGLALPLCVGDGGLEEVKVKSTKSPAVIELTYGSGSNEELRFQVIKGRWQLVSVEWFDH